MEIIIKDLQYHYAYNTPLEKKVLHNINMTIPKGSYTAIIGHTGSGKSTLIQHLNGLLLPTGGMLKIGEFTIRAGEKPKNLKQLRKKVGLVFQYPEHQLFADTVFEDILFGPKNFGMDEKEAAKQAKRWMFELGLSEEICERPPFALSGGEKRRVAICGVLCSMPEVLVLDEPTAGLDPQGQKEIMQMIQTLHKQHQLTIVHVTHNMDEVALYADQVYILKDGQVALSGKPEQIFADRHRLYELHLDVPDAIDLMYQLEEKTGQKTPKNKFTVEEVTNFITSELFKK